jgi:hypothetical protein
MRCFELLAGLFAAALATSCDNSVPTSPSASFVPEPYPRDSNAVNDVASLAPATAR